MSGDAYTNQGPSKKEQNYQPGSNSQIVSAYGLGMPPVKVGYIEKVSPGPDGKATITRMPLSEKGKKAFKTTSLKEVLEQLNAEK